MQIRRKDSFLLFILMLPALALILLFVVIPALWAVYISFTNQSLLGPQSTSFDFIGLDNYRRLFSDSGFWNSLQITFVFVFFSSVLGQSVIGLILALVLKSGQLMGKGVIGGIVVLAWIMPEIVTVYIWASVLNFDSGSANQLLALIGLEHQRWLIDMPLLSLIVVNIWRGTAFSMLLFSSALEGISELLYDAAAVDGAGTWQQFIHITFPLLKPTILINAILVTISGFSAFGIIYALTGGGPLQRSEVISVYVYKNAFQFRDIGYGSAASVMMFLGNLAFGVLYFGFLREKITGAAK